MTVSSTTGGPISLSKTEFDPGGRVTWQMDARGGLTAYGYDSAGQRIAVTNYPGWSRTYTGAYTNLLGVTTYPPTNTVAVVTRSVYDPNGNVAQEIDPLGNTTSYFYDESNRRVATLFPAIGTNAPAATQTVYDSLGRKVQDIDEAGVVTAFGYDALGRLTSVTNDALAATGVTSLVTTYGYDAVGNLVTQTDGLGRTSRFEYDGFGRRTRRIWPGSSNINDYSSGTNANPVVEVTTYTNVPSGTSGVAVWERRVRDGRGLTVVTDEDVVGRVATVGFPTIYQGAATLRTSRTNRFTYTVAGMIDHVDTVDSGGTLRTTYYKYDDARRRRQADSPEGVLTWQRDAQGNIIAMQGYRRSAVTTNALGANTSTAISQGYTYDSAGRLSTVTDGIYSAAYGYYANSRLVNTVTSQQNSTTRLTVSRNYDLLERLRGVTSTPAATNQLPDFSGYQYNSANQRTRRTLADGSYWVYAYDTLGQVISGKRYWGDGTPVAGQQFEYAFDDIGNRKSTKAGGDQTGANLRSATYTPTLLNQYTSRSVPSAMDVLGLATATSTVTVNGSSSGVYRRGEYFRKEVAVANSTAPVWQSLSLSAGGTATAGNLFVAAATENFGSPSNPTTYPGYDLDGNLLRDGRWLYTWDAENRLVKMQPLDYQTAPANSRRQLDFEYDALGRRIHTKVTNLDTNAVTRETRFLYDGWNVMAELNGASGTATVRTYLWGLDLSGSLQGAGGVGGLLAVRDSSSGVSHFAGYDGNGDVTLLVDGSSGSVSGAYEYGPFGESLRVTGTMGATNPFAFSTKFTDRETDLQYYDYRFYCPSIGRWLSRDPASEPGFSLLANGGPDERFDADGDGNLYAFVADNPINQIDTFGLAFYAIDGTWTDATDKSNPWFLSVMTRESPARYFRGPYDGPSGLDSGWIALHVWKRVCEDYCAADGNNFTVNFTGWSRGAVAAVAVAQLLNDVGCNCGCGWPRGWFGGWKKPIPVNWVGLFDAVKQTPVMLSKSVPPNVANFYHAVKTSKSWLYPTVRYGRGTEYKIYNYNGTLSNHADVGKSQTRNANLALPLIKATAIASGVKF